MGKAMGAAVEAAAVEAAAVEAAVGAAAGGAPVGTLGAAVSMGAAEGMGSSVSSLSSRLFGGAMQ